MGLWLTYICVSRTQEKNRPRGANSWYVQCEPRVLLQTPRLLCPPLFSGVSCGSAQNALSSPPSDPQAPVSLALLWGLMQQHPARSVFTCYRPPGSHVPRSVLGSLTAAPSMLCLHLLPCGCLSGS